MKAMVLTQFGGPEVFEEREVPLPQPQAHQLLVKVYATSVNPMDIQFRQGAGQWAGIIPSAILGYDVSGSVVAVGDQVRDFQVGNDVYYTPDPFAGQGSNAEYHVVHEAIVARKPATLTHLDAASIPLVGSTVWEALMVRPVALARLPFNSPGRRGRPSLPPVVVATADSCSHWALR